MTDTSSSGEQAAAVGQVSPATPPNVTPPTPTTSAAAGSTGMTFDQVENTWIQAGGNPQAAAMAAAIADAESGLNPGATRTNPDGTTGVGLWLLPTNGTPPGSTDPISAARAAIQLSNNGTDWTQWCVAWSDNDCGLSGGTYLGSGSNALMSLGQQAEPSSYNVFGSTPAGSGVGASSATGTSTTTGTSGTSHTIIMIVILAVIGVGIYYLMKHYSGGGDGGDGGGSSRSPAAPDTPNVGDTVHIPAHERRRAS